MAASNIKTRFRVEGMDCAGCALKVEKAALQVDGVEDVTVSVTAATMTVTHAETADPEFVAKAVTSLGYPTARIAEPAKAAQNKVVSDPDNKRPVLADSYDQPPGHRHTDRGGHYHSTSKAGAVTEPADIEVSEANLHGHVHDHGSSKGPLWRSSKARLTLVSGAAVVLAYTFGYFVPSVAAWAFMAALAVGLLPIARRAFLAARFGTPFSIEMLMTIAAAGAVVIGAVEEAAAVVFLFLVGELLEGVAASRARASIQDLTKLVPKMARIERGGVMTEVDAETLRVGDVIIVRPGDRIPADGVIVEGNSSIIEAPVTGESVPKSKTSSDNVFAGTVNGDGLLRVRVTATAADNTIARVVRLVEEAQEAKAPTERFIDRFSRWYTPGVVLVAALVAVLPPLVGFGSWGEWVYKGLAILLIGCPCALVISTPAAIAAGLSSGARRGLLMKGGAVLEQAGRLTAIALDKTGTLTEGKPRVTDVFGARGDNGKQEVLALAAALEAGSSHPLALAIVSAASEGGVSVPVATDVKAIPGKGVEGRVNGALVFLGSAAAAEEIGGLSAGQRAVVATRTDEGKSVSVLLKDRDYAGVIAMRDEPRADARRGLDALKAAGIKVLMLTGDNRRTAEAVAAALGIEPRAELLPQDKQRIVLELQAQGYRVGKVGDGINDAPALAAADIGIAMGGGTDVALETADAAVLHGRVMDIANMIRLSRSVMVNIRQNIIIALGLKAVFLVTTIAGVTGLWPAILADTGATVLVTANAMRLLRWKGDS